MTKTAPQGGWVLSADRSAVMTTVFTCEGASFISIIAREGEALMEVADDEKCYLNVLTPPLTRVDS